MDRVCQWENGAASRVVHIKKAIGAALFISFFGYTAAVILSELLRDKAEKVSVYLKFS